MKKLQSKPPVEDKKSRIYLIDDHPLLVEGISQLIDAEPHLKVIGSSGEWTVALKKIPELMPGLVYSGY